MATQSRPFRILILSVLAILTVAAGGIAHGLVTDRWGLPVRVAEIAGRVRSLPPVIGTWKSTETPMDPRQLEMAGAVGAVSRTYEDSLSGERVQIHLLAGRPGPISLHEPTVCFAGAGLNQIEGLSKYDVEGSSPGVKAQFSKTVFRTAQAGDRGLFTLWTWSPDGAVWRAPEHPRSAFAGSGCLFKLYVITEPSRSAEGASQLSPAAQSFVASLLDVLQTVVGGSTAPAASSSET